MSSQDVLDALDSIIASQQVFNGENAVYVEGPGGVWKIKRYKNPRGYFNLNVNAPGRGQPLYSIAAVREALKDNALAPMDQQDDVALEVEAFLEPNAFDQLAAMVEVDATIVDPACTLRACHRIQTAYRSHRYRLQISTRLNLTRELERVREALVEATHRVGLAGASCVDSINVEGAFLLTCTHLSPLLLKHPIVTLTLHTTLPLVANLLTIMSHPTDLDRDLVSGRAADVMVKHPAKSMAYKTAKAVSMCPHFPLIIGSLPLPGHSTFAFRKTYVRCSQTLSEQHTSLLTATFGRKWVKHVQVVMNRRDVRAFDFFSDRSLTAYECSLIVTKHLLRVRGKVLPAIHIVCMSSSSRGRGNGSLMMELCKVLLFSDGVEISKGIVFAQCLKIDFWDYRLHEDARAQALILQMYMLYEEQEFEESCVIKMTEYENVDDSAPSPAKTLT